jgi:hypothetical protein
MRPLPAPAGRAHEERHEGFLDQAAGTIAQVSIHHRDVVPASNHAGLGRDVASPHCFKVIDLYLEGGHARAAWARRVPCEPPGRFRQRRKHASVNQSVNLLVRLVHSYSEHNTPILGFGKHESELLRREAHREPLFQLASGHLLHGFQGARYLQPYSPFHGRRHQFSDEYWHPGWVPARLICVGGESSASSQAHACEPDRFVRAGGGWRGPLRAS